MLLPSFLVFLAVYAGFGVTTNTIFIGCLFVLYGLYQGIFHSVGKALATDLVPSELHASCVVWHMATVAAGKEFGDLAEAEVVVFKPLGEGKFKVVTRVASPATWSSGRSKSRPAELTGFAGLITVPA